MGDKSRGWFDKFRVTRNDGTGRKGKKHHRCTYFVLDLDHDPHARPALLAYAESAERDGYRSLAHDIREKVRVHCADGSASAPKPVGAFAGSGLCDGQLAMLDNDKGGRR